MTSVEGQGPFLVTVRTPDERTGPSGEASHVEFVSHQAFEKIDGARRHAVAEVRRLRLQHPADDAAWNGADTYYRLVASFLPVEGGTVGPLPDGATITVEKADWAVLAGQAGLDLKQLRHMTGRLIVDRWNDRFERGAR